MTYEPGAVVNGHVLTSDNVWVPLAVLASATTASATTVNVGRAPASHALHLILTIVTCGLWAPVWIVAGILGRRR